MIFECKWPPSNLLSYYLDWWQLVGILSCYLTSHLGQLSLAILERYSTMSSRGRLKPFFQFRLKPKVHLHHGTKNETETFKQFDQSHETDVNEWALCRDGKKMQLWRTDRGSLNPVSFCAETHRQFRPKPKLCCSATYGKRNQAENELFTKFGAETETEIPSTSNVIIVIIIIISSGDYIQW